jgi:hypothetical protein
MGRRTALLLAFSGMRRGFGPSRGAQSAVSRSNT